MLIFMPNNIASRTARLLQIHKVLHCTCR